MSRGIYGVGYCFSPFFLFKSFWNLGLPVIFSSISSLLFLSFFYFYEGKEKGARSDGLYRGTPPILPPRLDLLFVLTFFFLFFSQTKRIRSENGTDTRENPIWFVMRLAGA